MTRGTVAFPAYVEVQMTTLLQPEVPEKIRARLRELGTSIRYATIAWRVRNDLLTEDQREQAQPAIAEDRDIVGIWEYVHGVSEEKAVVEIAFETGFLFPAEHRRLLSHLGGTPSLETSQGQRKPYLGADGNLWFDGKRARSIRFTTVASTVERIIRSFDDANWPAEIDSPFGNVEANYVHQAVSTANDGLEFIRFQSRRSGRRIAWLPNEG